MSTASSPVRPIRSRRAARCAGCWLPEALCVCASLPRLAVRTRVVLVTHRREAISSTNTGRLAARMLEGAEVRVRGATGPEPAPAPLPERSGGACPPTPPGPQSRSCAPPLPEGRRLVLFPRSEARVLSAEDAAGGPVVLLVPDGTWSQARRLVLRDEHLAAAEAVTLPPSAPSRYLLRRHPREGALCTLEAVAQALGILEGPEVASRLLAALDGFVARGRLAREGRLVPRG